MDKKELSKEFSDLKQQIVEAARAIHRNELSHASFILGCIHSICRYHEENLIEGLDQDDCE